MLAPALASADSASSLSIVGTSDISDSGLMPNLIQPQFQAAFPQFTFKYTGSATGTAIQNAQSGNGGPSMLIVHAASLENQFVANGFSYQNQYGHAIFTNDFVLVGPASDPAGAETDEHNVAKSLADIAAAGVAGTAEFVSRGGGQTASGTTIEEHALWALVNSAGLTPAGVTLCTVSDADGGGMSPVNTGAQGAPCPDSGTVASPHNPTWYEINANSSQGQNMVATNACSFAPRPPNSCYTLSDRGTVDFLTSKNSPSAGTTGLPNLKIVARDNSASSPGGANALTNYFHIYIINPSKPGETVNLTAAQDFMNFITSSTIQSELKGYLTGTAGRQRNARVRGHGVAEDHRLGLPDHGHRGQARDRHRNPHQPRGGVSRARQSDGQHRRARGAHQRPRRQREDRFQRQLQHQVRATLVRVLPGRDRADLSD